MHHNRGDLYTVMFPFDDEEKEKIRPAIILDTKNDRSIVIKVTSHEERSNDDGDIEIKYWLQAGLDKPSVARCSLFIPLHHDKIIKYIGRLHDDDLINVLDKIYKIVG